MAMRAPLRVGHLLRSLRTGWSIALCAPVFALFSNKVYAQAGTGSTCGLADVRETAPLVYPPIAKAAHVSGKVILMATFAEDGSVNAADVISGSPMLAGRATEYVQGWKANAAPGVRRCPIVIEFRMIGKEHECDAKARPTKGSTIPVRRLDPQHVTITFDQDENCFTTCY